MGSPKTRPQFPTRPLIERRSPKVGQPVRNRVIRASSKTIRRSPCGEFDRAWANRSSACQSMTTMAKLIEVQVFERGRSLFAPSEAAVITWRSGFSRTSPATNPPGTLVAPLSPAIAYPASLRATPAANLSTFDRGVVPTAINHRIGIHDALIARISRTRIDSHMRHGHFPIGRRPNPSMIQFNTSSTFGSSESALGVKGRRHGTNRACAPRTPSRKYAIDTGHRPRPCCRRRLPPRPCRGKTRRRMLRNTKRLCHAAQLPPKHRALEARLLSRR